MGDLSGELHHRQRKTGIVGSENALLDRQCLAKGLLRMGGVVDRVICVAGAEVVKALQVAAAEGTSLARRRSVRGFGRPRSRAGDRPPAERPQGSLERRQGGRDSVGNEYPTSDRGR
jgi:hypothetical protein